ncbi:MAG: SDR family oxidoreductase [Crocinitomicaceae bacterium]|nr:SDR family oxidoreductase [Crocinitomicaceae bacterium]
MGCSEFDIREHKIISSITHVNPSIIIIAAGKSFVPDSWKYPNDFYSINTLGTINVAEAARISGAKIIFLSTFVYGAPYSLLISETGSAQPFNPYASSKFLAELSLKNYFDFFGVASSVLRVFNVYGEGQKDDFLIPTIISQYKNGGSIHVKDLSPKRDYIHVDDLTDAIVVASKK